MYLNITHTDSHYFRSHFIHILNKVFSNIWRVFLNLAGRVTSDLVLWENCPASSTNKKNSVRPHSEIDSPLNHSLFVWPGQLLSTSKRSTYSEIWSTLCLFYIWIKAFYRGTIDWKTWGKSKAKKWIIDNRIYWTQISY